MVAEAVETLFDVQICAVDSGRHGCFVDVLIFNLGRKGGAFHHEGKSSATLTGGICICVHNM